MIKCLIIEDDYSSALNIKVILDELGYGEAEMILDYSKIENQHWLNSFDVLLCDVKLGNETYAFDILKKFDKLPPIVFFTSHNDPDLYQQSKKVSPYIFLLKPVSKVELRSAIEGSVASRRKVSKEDMKVLEGVVFVRSQGKLISVDPSRLSYANSEGNYCYLHIEGKKIVIRSSIKNLLNTMNHSSLQQVHRAYVVNTKKMESVDIASDSVTIAGVQIPIGRKYKKSLIDKLK